MVITIEKMVNVMDVRLTGRTKVADVLVDFVTIILQMNTVARTQLCKDRSALSRQIALFFVDGRWWISAKDRPKELRSVVAGFHGNLMVVLLLKELDMF